MHERHDDKPADPAFEDTQTEVSLDTTELRLWVKDRHRYYSVPDDVQPDRRTHILDAGDHFAALEDKAPLGGARVLVLGGGPIGLWTAVTASHAGAVVDVVDDGRHPTGLAAAGWGFPYHSTDARAMSWSVMAHREWCRAEMFLPPGAVSLEPTTVQRGALAEPFPDEYEKLPGFRRLEEGELSPGMAEGIACQSVMVPGQLWMPALRDLLVRRGVGLIHHHVPDFRNIHDLKLALGADLVVDAMGLTSGQLLHDPAFTPLRGTVVYLGTPADHPMTRSIQASGIRSWDEGSPDHRDPYVIPQAALKRLVVGGETTPMSIEEARAYLADGCPVDPVVADAILDRAIELDPRLADLPVVGARAGVRPARPTMRVERSHSVRWLVHASGHGGAGVTMAPVTATEVVRLLTLVK